MLSEVQSDVRYKLADLTTGPDFRANEFAEHKRVVRKAQPATWTKHSGDFLQPFLLVCPVMKRQAAQDKVCDLIGKR